MAGADPPQMQIGDAVVASGFEPLGDRAGDPLGPHVEQHAAGDADEAPRPVEDHPHADEAHHRVHPHPAEQASGAEADHRQYRDRGIGHHVDIGGAQIVVGVVVVVVMIMVSVIMPVRMRMVATGVLGPVLMQQPGADEVDGEAERGQGDRLVEGDRHRMEQPVDALVTDQQCDHRQHDRAGKGGEIAELAGAERETIVAGVAPGIGIGERGDDQRPGMGRHVQPVGDQRHRAPQPAADDLGRHHRAAQPDDSPAAPLVALVMLAQKDVLVAPGLDQFGVHRALQCYPC